MCGLPGFVLLGILQDLERTNEGGSSPAMAFDTQNQVFDFHLYQMYQFMLSETSEILFDAKAAPGALRVVAG